MGVEALDRLDADHAFMLGLVGQHRRARHVADGIDARHVGVAIAIDDDAALVGFDAEGFKAEVFDVADHTRGGDDAVHGDRFATCRRLQSSR